MGLPLDKFFYYWNMSVVNMGVRNNVDKLSGFQTAYLRKHMHKRRILADVYAVSRKKILGTLVQNGVKPVSGHVEGHAVSAGVQVHFRQVVMIV